MWLIKIQFVSAEVVITMNIPITENLIKVQVYKDGLDTIATISCHDKKSWQLYLRYNCYDPFCHDFLGLCLQVQLLRLGSLQGNNNNKVLI